MMYLYEKILPPRLQKTGITNQTAEEHLVSPGIVSPKFTFQRRVPMSATTDKVKGAANEAIGKAKQGVGEAVGSDRLQGEGVIQEVKGKGQKAVGDAKQATKDAVNTAASAANKNL
jgi:uncharacterized protein YjbJ (UPF0337 family)